MEANNDMQANKAAVEHVYKWCVDLNPEVTNHFPVATVAKRKTKHHQSHVAH